MRGALASPDLLFLVLPLLLQAGNLAALLFFQFDQLAKIPGGASFGDEIAQKDFLLGDLGLVERVNFGQLLFLRVGQRNAGAVLAEAFHGEFVGGFHALRKFVGKVWYPIMSNSGSTRKWWMTWACLWGLSGLSMEKGRAIEELPSPPPLTLTLVSETVGFEPGKPFTVGLWLEHAPHHHSYYKFPGIVGVPTSVEWELPEGFAVGAFQWPTPERVDMRGHGAYGYHDDTLLLAEVTTPSTFQSGDRAVLKGKVIYMCCSQEKCTPGYQDVRLEVEAGRVAEVNSAWKPRFDASRKQQPRPLAGWESRVSQSDTFFRLALRPPADLKEAALPRAQDLYFFSWNGWTASDQPHQCEWEDGEFVFRMPKHPYPEEDATRFQGTVRSETGWPGAPKVSKGLWIDLPLPPDGSGSASPRS